MDKKTCTKCGGTKQVSEFHKCSKVSDGLASRCKSCVSANWRRNKSKYARAKQKYYQDNREEILRKQAVYSKNNPVRQKNQRKWCKQNRDELGDSYVKQVLVQQRGFKKEQITPELIKAERALIKLKRKIRETV